MSDARPTVNFYPLSATEPDAHLVFACRLAEKALGLGHHIHFHLDSGEQSREMDALLWQFRPSAFIPHARLDDPETTVLTGIRVSLGHGELMPANPDLLINLATQVFSRHGEFQRISDIVPALQPGLDQGRRRYRCSQDQGSSLETYRI